MRIYLDTSVYAAYDEEENKAKTRELFKKIAAGWFTVCYSNVVASEVIHPKTKALYNRIIKYGIFHPVIPAIVQLSRVYLSEGALPKKSDYDALHMAVCSFYNIDYLVSWDKKHIVNDRRLHIVNGINLRYGYHLLRVVTPENLL